MLNPGTALLHIIMMVFTGGREEPFKVKKLCNLLETNILALLLLVYKNSKWAIVYMHLNNLLPRGSMCLFLQLMVKGFPVKSNSEETLLNHIHILNQSRCWLYPLN